jgi:hypothetical protein
MPAVKKSSSNTTEFAVLFIGSYTIPSLPDNFTQYLPTNFAEEPYFSTFNSTQARLISSLVKDIAVFTALHASGVEDVISDEINHLYGAFTNIVPKKLRQRLTGEETTSVVLRLCWLSDDQAGQLNLEGQILLRNELSTYGKKALATALEAIDIDAAYH